MASTDRNRVLLLVAALVVVTGWALVQRWGSVSGSSSSLGSSQARFEPHQVPKLETDLLLRSRTPVEGSPRSPFAHGAPPTPTRDPRPTPTPQPTPTPPPPPPTRTPGPSPTPLPPAFDRVYIGHLGPARLPVAVFRKGEALEIATPGTILDNRFILRQVGLESVVIGFVGYPEEVTTRVPLAEN